MKKFLLLGLLLTPLLTIPAAAHEAPCPFCSQTITQDTTTQDNEVALKIGRKRIEYKCPFCALSEAATEYSGDLSILTPSETKGQPIQLKRTGGVWSASAPEVAFVACKASHKICQVTYRSFSTTAEAQKYIAANADSVGNSKPLSLTQMLQLTGNKDAKAAPAPQGGDK